MRRPVYQRIADDLREQIRSGKLPPGAQLPTQAELVLHHEVARGTIERAIDLLVHEGLVATRPPQGAFVRNVAPVTYRPQAYFTDPPGATMDRLMDQLTREGRTPHQAIEVAIVEPPPVVSAQLAAAGELVAVRRRVISTRTEPEERYQAYDTYYPLDLVRDSEIMLPHDITRGAGQVLAELGAREVRMAVSARARQPTSREASRLDIAGGVPVLDLVETGYTTSGRAVRCAHRVMVGPLHILEFEFTRPAG
jgi:DNA-binding GntR family transcriptional regulator